MADTMPTQHAPSPIALELARLLLEGLIAMRRKENGPAAAALLEEGAPDGKLDGQTDQGAGAEPQT